MSVAEQLVFTVVDKALAGALLAAIGFWLDRRFDLLRSGRSLMQALLDRRQGADLRFLATQRDRSRERIEKQLSLLYWPLYVRLQQHEAARAHAGAAPGAAGGLAHGDTLASHVETVKLIEKNAYLIDDDDLLAVLLRYMKHVAVQRPGRVGDGAGEPRAGDGAGAPRAGERHERYPEELLALVERKLAALRAEQRRLLQAGVLDAAL